LGVESSEKGATIMHIHSTRRALGLAAVALLLGACGSSGMGDILGGGNDYPQQNVGEVRGTVRGVDTRDDCAIELRDSDYVQTNDLRNSSGTAYGSGDTTVVYCDGGTEVVHEGRSYRPDALEPGDRVAVQVRESGGRLIANRIDVLYDVSSGERYGDYAEDDRDDDDDRYDNDDGYRDDRSGLYGDLRGRVRRVDESRRTIELERVEYYDRGMEFERDDDRVTLLYDDQTTVRFEGRTYRPDNLEVGDVIEVEVDTVRGQLVADQIEVVTDVRAAYPR
jgi:hypothetical protein